MQKSTIRLNSFDSNIVDVKELTRFIEYSLSNSTVQGGVFSEVIKRTENKLSQFLGRECVLTNSGTNALFVSLEYALHLANNKKTVINISEYTFFALAGMLSKLDNVTINILKAEEDEVTLNKSDIVYGEFTIFLLTSHNNRNVNHIIDKSDDVFIIEDRCVVIGEPGGSYSDVSCYSFSNNKLITSGEGGCLSTSNQNFLDWVKWRIYNGIKPLTDNPFFFYLGKIGLSEFGNHYKCTLNNISALCIGAQIDVFDKLVEKRRENFKYLADAFEIPFQVPHAPLFFQLPVNMQNRKVQHMQMKLFSNGIHSSIGILTYDNMIRQTEKTIKYLNLPIHSSLDKSDLDKIVIAVKEYS